MNDTHDLMRSENAKPQHDPYKVKPYTPSVKLNAPPVNKQSRLEWAPLAGPQNIPFSGTDYDAVRKALTGMWGPFPIRLSRERGDMESMKAMMHAAGLGQQPFRILHEALEMYGEIEVRDL